MSKEIRVEITSECSEQEHFHQDIEIIYVLEGSFDLWINSEKLDLSKGDVFLINANKKHKIIRDETILLCKIYIDYFMVAEALKKERLLFNCNSLMENYKEYSKLRYIINSMLREIVSNNFKESFLVRSLQYKLLDCLSEEFIVETSDQWSEKEGEAISQIVQYINYNYNRTITLNEMAQKLYMSDSSFSRFFKKNLGVNFVEYVNNVRLCNSIELLNSDKSITTIAMECGFSNPSVFNKNFKQYYKMSPTEYKKKNGKKVLQNLNTIDKNSEKRVKKYLENENLKIRVVENVKEKVKVITSNSRINRYKEKSCFNFGMAIDLLQGKLREQLLQLKSKIDIKYIRICNPFHTEMYVKKDESGQWNFKAINNVFDFIISNDMHLVVDLANKPKRASLHIGEDIFFDSKNTIPIYSSIEEWESLIFAFFKNIIHRYGENEIKKCFFEFWYDENWFEKDGVTTTYMEVWEVTYNTIKEIMPEIKIGGNGLHTFYKGNILEEHLRFWKNSKCKPDFLTTYIYPYKNEELGEEKYIRRATDSMFLKNGIDVYYNLLNKLDYTDTEVFVTEWNTCLSERNYYNDSCGKAAHIVRQILSSFESIGLLSYWHVCDLLSQYFDVKTPINGSTGIISRDGIEKPAFYSYYFLQRLGEYIIDKNEKYIITTDGRNNYYILLCNAKRFNHNYYLKRENEIIIEDLDNIFEDDNSIEFEIELKEIENGEYYIKKYKLNEENGSVIGAWKNFECICDLKKEDIEYMKNICIPKIEINKNVVEKNILKININLLTNEITFIHIYKY